MSSSKRLLVTKRHTPQEKAGFRIGSSCVGVELDGDLRFSYQLNVI